MTARHARRADLPAIIDIWADAFTGDPFLTWLGGGPDRWSGFGPQWMRFIAELTFERGHTYIDGDRAAVAWIPPDLAFAPPEDMARGRAVIEASAGEERAELAVETIMAAHVFEPAESHWVLQYIGVRSSAGGTGVGAELVKPMLAVADTEGLATSLISSNPRNVSFYERHGFVVEGEITTPDGAATLRPMVRSA